MKKYSDKEIKQQLKNALSVLDPWFAYQQYITEYPSVAVGVVYKDDIVFAKGYGHADIAKKIKATPKTCYRIASNSKVFTALGVMQLVKEEKLRLSDPVKKHLPWFQSPKEKVLAKITIKDLLTNSSGLIREGYTDQWMSDNFATEEEIKSYIKKGIISKHPKGKFKYSNLGFAILGLVVEKASGQSYSEFMRKIISEPLGLSLTDAQLTPSIKKHLAKGYSRKLPNKKREIFINPETNAMEGATGFTSNVEDLCTFMAAQFFGNDALTSDAEKRQLFKRHIRNQKNEWTGLGFESWNVGKRNILGHGGGFQGYTTITAFDAKAEIGITVLVNASLARTKMFANEFFKVLDYFLQHSGEYSQAPRSQLKKYEGTYSSRWGEVQVTVVGNRLWVIDPSAPMLDWLSVIEPKGKNKFDIKIANPLDKIGETAQFLENKNGKMTGMLWGSDPLDKIS